MILIIQIGSITKNLKYKSHLESAATEEDIERRYLVEAGTEKMSELNICIDEALTQVQIQCSRFLDSYTVEGGQVSISLTGTERRFEHKQEQLKQMITSFIVDYALMKYYLSVAKYEMSKAREQIAVSELQTIRNLLYEKNPPKFD